MIVFGVSKQIKIACRSWDAILRTAQPTGYQYQYLKERLVFEYAPDILLKQVSYISPQHFDLSGKPVAHIYTEIQYALSPILIHNQLLESELYLIHNDLSDPHIEISKTYP